MNKAKIIESLKQINEGTQNLIKALEEDCSCDCAESTPVEVAEENTTSVPLTKEVLEQMSYNDLKKLCKELGVKAVGNTAQLIERLLETDSVVEVEEEVDIDEEEEVVEITQEDVAEEDSVEEEEVEEETEEDEVELEEDEAEEDEVAQLVKAEAEGMTVAEILDILTEAGITPKCKKTKPNLIEELVKAVNSGVIAIDVESDDEEDAVEDDGDDNAKVIEVDFNADEEDGAEEEITEARAKAIEELKESYATMVEDGELTVDEMAEFLEEFYNEYPEDLSDEEVFEVYCNTVAKLIDDDGELHEEGAYAINGEFYCCGKPLKYAEETNKFICESCGAEYEAE